MKDTRVISHYFYSLLFTIAMVLFISLPAKADDQIVTDPVLNTALNQIEKLFPTIIQQEPSLTIGAVPEIDLAGSKGSLSFSFEQDNGSFAINFDSLKFSPTNPISANKFNITLTAKNITLAGSATIMVMANGQQYTLQCQDSQFVIGPISFTAEAEITKEDINVDNPKLDFDPANLMIDMPCLMQSVAGRDGKAIPMDVLKKLQSAIKSSASKRKSSVSKATRMSFMLLSSAITFRGAN